MIPPLAPVKGAQVPKVGRCQRRLSQKPKFVVFFLEAFPKGRKHCPHKKKLRESWGALRRS